MIVNLVSPPIYLPIGFTICVDSPTRLGFALIKSNFIVICPVAVGNGPAPSEFPRTLQDRQQDWSQNFGLRNMMGDSPVLEDMLGGLVGTLWHEAHHAMIKSSADTTLDGTYYNLDGYRVEMAAYRYSGVTKLVTQEVDKMDKGNYGSFLNMAVNADTAVYVGAAIYLIGNDWSMDDPRLVLTSGRIVYPPVPPGSVRFFDTTV